MKDIKKISVDGAIIKSYSKQEVGKNTKQGTNSIKEKMDGDDNGN